MSTIKISTLKKNMRAALNSVFIALFLCLMLFSTLFSTAFSVSAASNTAHSQARTYTYVITEEHYRAPNSAFIMVDKTAYRVKRYEYANGAFVGAEIMPMYQQIGNKLQLVSFLPFREQAQRIVNELNFKETAPFRNEQHARITIRQDDILYVKPQTTATPAATLITAGQENTQLLTSTTGVTGIGTITESRVQIGQEITQPLPSFEIVSPTATGVSSATSGVNLMTIKNTDAGSTQLIPSSSLTTNAEAIVLTPTFLSTLSLPSSSSSRPIPIVSPNSLAISQSLANSIFSNIALTAGSTGSNIVTSPSPIPSSSSSTTSAAAETLPSSQKSQRTIYHVVLNQDGKTGKIYAAQYNSYGVASSIAISDNIDKSELGKLLQTTSQDTAVRAELDKSKNKIIGAQSGYGQGKLQQVEEIETTVPLLFNTYITYRTLKITDLNGNTKTMVLGLKQPSTTSTSSTVTAGASTVSSTTSATVTTAADQNNQYFVLENRLIALESDINKDELNSRKLLAAYNEIILLNGEIEGLSVGVGINEDDIAYLNEFASRLAGVSYNKIIELQKEVELQKLFEEYPELFLFDYGDEVSTPGVPDKSSTSTAQPQPVTKPVKDPGSVGKPSSSGNGYHIDGKTVWLEQNGIVVARFPATQIDPITREKHEIALQNNNPYLENGKLVWGNYVKDDANPQGNFLTFVKASPDSQYRHNKIVNGEARFMNGLDGKVYMEKLEPPRVVDGKLNHKDGKQLPDKERIFFAATGAQGETYVRDEQGEITKVFFNGQLIASTNNDDFTGKDARRRPDSKLYHDIMKIAELAGDEENIPKANDIIDTLESEVKKNNAKKSKAEMASTVSMWQSLTFYEGLSALSPFFFDKKTLRNWAESVDKLFATFYLGTDYWSSSVCRASVSFPNHVGFIETADGSVLPSANIQGEKTVIAHPNRTNPSQTVTEYIYKITYFVDAVEEDMNFNILIDSTPFFVRRTNALVVRADKKVSKGSSESALGEKAIVKVSGMNFNKLCLSFDKDYFDIGSKQICTSFADQGNAQPSTLPVKPTAGSTQTEDSSDILINPFFSG